MKKLLFCGIILLAFTHGFSQSINYDILRDDPKMFIHLKGGMLYDGDFSSGNNRSGYYFNGSFNLGKRITIAGEYQMTKQKWDNVSKQAMNIIQKNPNNFSARGSFYFQSKEQKENVKVSLKKTSSNVGYFTYTNETYIMAPATTLRKVGVTGSAGYYLNSIRDNQKYDTLFSLVDNNGTSYNSLNYGTYFSGARFTGGINFSMIQNFVINAQNAQTGETYGKKSVRNKVDVIVEALWMPVVSVETGFIQRPENGGSLLSLSEKPAVRNLGYRLIVDADWVSVIGIGLRLEFGSRPGILFNTSSSGNFKNFYAAFGLNIGINK
ncbi:MAG: hypothetical protein ACK47F_04825 [Flavobacteriales bacterium]